MKYTDIKLPICPDCQGTLRYTGVAFDKCEATVSWAPHECCSECGREMEMYDEDYALFNCEGYCLRCGKVYHWVEKYSFTTVTSMECVGEREV